MAAVEVDLTSPTEPPIDQVSHKYRTMARRYYECEPCELTIIPRPGEHFLCVRDGTERRDRIAISPKDIVWVGWGQWQTTSLDDFVSGGAFLLSKVIYRTAIMFADTIVENVKQSILGPVSDRPDLWAASCCLGSPDISSKMKWNELWNMMQVRFEPVEAWKDLKPSDHIVVKRAYGISHHGIVISVDTGEDPTVCHHTKQDGVFAVVLTSLSTFIRPSGPRDLYKVIYPDGMTLGADQTLTLAYQALDDTIDVGFYNFLFNNCEHLATLLKIGKNFCLQTLNLMLTCLDVFFVMTAYAVIIGINLGKLALKCVDYLITGCNVWLPRCTSIGGVAIASIAIDLALTLIVHGSPALIAWWKGENYDAQKARFVAAMERLIGRSVGFAVGVGIGTGIGLFVGHPWIGAFAGGAIGSFIGEAVTRFFLQNTQAEQLLTALPDRKKNATSHSD
ncbi:hypothetical protein Pelo_10372 [Pelomyxa schiedti]|nr:hypothetical protein Pelo_10372 [Pelomyxa schiedti]